MAKKTKIVKSLPSASTAASAAQPNPQSLLATAKSAAAETAKPTEPTRKPLVPETAAATASTPQPAAPAAPKAVGMEQAPTPAASPTVKVTFALLEPRAQRVALCGGFNAWSPETTPMNRQSDGRWETSLALPPGRHEYKFVVDGRWLPDPNARDNVFNEHGTLNSVVVVQA